MWWTNEWKDGWMNEWMKWINEWHEIKWEDVKLNKMILDQWMVWMNEWKNERIDESMNEWICDWMK